MRKEHSGGGNGKAKALMGQCFRRFKKEPRGRCGQGRVGTRKKVAGAAELASPRTAGSWGGLGFYAARDGALSGWSAEEGRMWLFPQSLWLLFTVDPRGQGE